MVMAIDNRTLPIQFNHLIGSAQVNETDGPKTSFNAIAFAKNTPGAVDRDDDNTTASLQFNDEIFDRWPATTALAFVTSQYDNSLCSGFRARPTVCSMRRTRAALLTVTLYDELIAVFSATAPRTENRLNQLRPSLLQPPITNTILPGQRGWLKLLSGTPVLSWSENMATAPFTASAGNWRGGFNGGGNLHALTTADDFTLKVPAYDSEQSRALRRRRKPGTANRSAPRRRNDCSSRWLWLGRRRRGRYADICMDRQRLAGFNLGESDDYKLSPGEHTPSN